MLLEVDVCSQDFQVVFIFCYWLRIVRLVRRDMMRGWFGNAAIAVRRDRMISQPILVSRMACAPPRRALLDTLSAGGGAHEQLQFARGGARSHHGKRLRRRSRWGRGTRTWDTGLAAAEPTPLDGAARPAASSTPSQPKSVHVSPSQSKSVQVSPSQSLPWAENVGFHMVL